MSEKSSAGRRIRLETPEHVRLDYELADVGSRLAALLIDMAIIIGSLILLGMAYALLRDGAMSLVDSLAASVLVIGFFALQWGYFLLFELLRDGQTPGKKVLRLRVLHSSGQPVSVRGSVIRNVLRIVDFQPAVTGVLGGGVMMLTGRSQRLGDLAADTIVVRDDGAGEIAWPEAARTPAAGRPLLSAEQFELLSNYRRRRDDLSRERGARWPVPCCRRSGRHRGTPRSSRRCRPTSSWCGCTTRKSPAGRRRAGCGDCRRPPWCGSSDGSGRDSANFCGSVARAG